jgi:hypothetical protein
MESKEIWSTTYNVKSSWFIGRKILKLVKEKHHPISAFRTGFNEVVFTLDGKDDAKKQEIYGLLIKNGAKEVEMVSGLSTV